MTIVPILTYGPNTEAPPHMTWCAAMVPDARPGTHWLATGPTPEAARAKLEDMWARQNPPPSKRGAHLKKASEPVVAVDDDTFVL